MKAKKSFGGCKISKYAPGKIQITNKKVVSIFINFEEAMKLNLALQSALLKMNTYNRSERAVKNTNVKLSVFFDTDRILIA